ncbi:UNVERIFIED_CONTAM: hypothetical protein GTU68_012548 [Idotea baltica]|nr:hypothetical protein [Idotea baltica]
MRRIMQSTGAEVIHLGHNRSVQEIVDCAIQEDVQGIAITSYQGGHVEYFKYMHDLLEERGAGHIKIFGGGGGTILPIEMEELHTYGIDRIFSPDDGRSMGLQGMINHVIENCDYANSNGIHPDSVANLPKKNPGLVGRVITIVENDPKLGKAFMEAVDKHIPDRPIPILGITGTGGAGKSSLTDEIVRRFLLDFEDKSIAVLSVDPSKRRTGGALLGDRIRMNAIFHPRVYMRSMATRSANISMSEAVDESVRILKAAQYDLVIVETAGIGQSDSEITDVADVALYVMTPEYGAATQLEKIDMLDFADLICINKFDKRGALDALRDVAKQFQRNHNLWDQKPESMPVFGTIASQFNDPGTNQLYARIVSTIENKLDIQMNSTFAAADEMSEKIFIIPPERVRYLAEIAEEGDRYEKWIDEQSAIARKLFNVEGTINHLTELGEEASSKPLEKVRDDLTRHLSPESQDILNGWDTKVKNYQGEQFSYFVRGKEIKVDNFVESLSHTRIPKICLPKYKDFGEILRWSLRENVPGEYPYTAGVYPFKRTGEDPTRMFAGEGGPERTNKRFHYVSLGMPAARLSTAFDSVTLYGEDPDHRPDIYGKIGNSGVSIASMDDAKKLYSGFDLCKKTTSVSMTINGPAPMLLAFYMNTAIDQQCEKYIRENGLLDEADVYAKIKAQAIATTRGTVQADILKEDQAQNTCIFSTEFALRMMGDIQQYFIDEKVRNFYSVSISGYHIAEAGANPITQLAFTLSNGFTFVEYYLSRGMDINDFAPNLSFFFSNGMDPEYSVIGRVARRIWSKAIRNKYKGNGRSQMLKYHIQTSGRSLHAQEIAFNDIRTTLQALYAIYDNCNSLHTNAYDEAITTPTEDSVRRAMAIQLIINKELGLANNENPLQGSFIIEELTDLVEEAVMTEFRRITDRGGVLGAMERQYQRSKIQEESLHYEMLKHTGDLPIVGVNTFLSSEGSPTIIPKEVIRSTTEEKETQISNVHALQARNEEEGQAALRRLQLAAIRNENLFEALMEAAKVCSLGQMTRSLYEVGGQYRRNM